MCTTNCQLNSYTWLCGSPLPPATATLRDPAVESVDLLCIEQAMRQATSATDKKHYETRSGASVGQQAPVPLHQPHPWHAATNPTTPQTPCNRVAIHVSLHCDVWHNALEHVHREPGNEWLVAGTVMPA